MFLAPAVLMAAVSLVVGGALGCSQFESTANADISHDYPAASQIAKPLQPGPPPHAWRTDALVARTHEASITVHQFTMSDRIFTLLYSVELTAESAQTADVVPHAQLISYPTGQSDGAVAHKVLHRAPGVSLGALSFELSGTPDYLSLQIDALTVEDFASGTQRTLVGPSQIPLLRKRLNDPQVSGFSFGSWTGRRYSDANRVKSFGKSTPHYDTAGDPVVLGMYKVIEEVVYFAIRPDGGAVEISEEHYSRLKDSGN